MIEDLLRADAAAWQRDLDAGARAGSTRTRPDWRLLAAVAAVLLLVAGLATAVALLRHRSHDTPPAVDGLTGVRWVDPVSLGELTFSTRTVLVDDGCHAEDHEYSLTATSMTVVRTLGGLNMSGCQPSAAMSAFDRFAIGRLTYVRNANLLRLSNGVATMDLHAEPFRTLTGTRWVLTHPTSGAGAGLTIDPDGAVRAGDACGRVTGRAVVAAAQRTIRFRTRSTCRDPEHGPATRSIENVLTTSSRYAIRGDTLTLSSGTTVLVYTDTDADPQLDGVDWVDSATHGEVVFAARSILVDDGCSSVTYRLSRTPHTLTIGSAFGTAGVCTGNPTSPPTRLTPLGRGGGFTYQRSGGTLRITHGATSIALHAQPLRHLAGGRWVMDEPIAGTVLTIALDGTVQASDGCGRVRGKARITEAIGLSATSVSFDTTVNGLCPGPPPQGALIDRVLTGRARFGISQDTLVLANGKDILTYHAG